MTVTSEVVDSVARVFAEAVDGYVFASGVTQDVTDAAPLVVPLADDFTEVGLPMVTCAMGLWEPALNPGMERLTFTILGAVWRPRVPLGENTSALYADRDAIADAFIAHTKAFLATGVQSAILAGGPGIVPRALPAGESQRSFLTLPFTVNVKLNRPVVPQPA